MIPPISGAIPTIPAIPTSATIKPTTATNNTHSFAQAAANALNAVQQTQTQSNNLALQAATGHGNVADYMISATQASLAIQMTTAVRDKAVSAFNQIMAMPL